MTRKICVNKGQFNNQDDEKDIKFSKTNDFIKNTQE